MSTKFKLALFLVPSLVAIGFLIWWLSPTRVVLRRVDALIELADVQILRLASPDELPGRLQVLVAPHLKTEAPLPIPSRSFTRAELADSFARLHESVGSCRITRDDALVSFPDSDEALVKTPIRVQLSWGRGSKRTMLYNAEMHLTKSPAGWLLDQITLTGR